MESNEEQPRSYLYTIGGYAIIIGGIYVYYKYTQSDRQRGRAGISGNADRTAIPPQRQEQPRPKRQDSGRTGEGAARRRRNNKPAAPSNPFEALPRESTQDEPEQDTQDLAYAESMAALREGNKLSNSKIKDVRNKAINRYIGGEPETDSSDNQKSNGQSPGAQAPNKNDRNAAQQAGVSDMLEPGAKAPSSLRVTPKEEKPAAVREDGWATVAKSKKEPNKQPTSAAVETESKKQRQNKKKNDEQKARNEEAERIRQSMLEEQRRTARVARGEAAKDGSKQTAQAINRWNERELNGGAVQAPTVPAPVPAMLDTYDQDGASTASSKDNAATWSPVSNSTANTNWGEGLPDEREQARILAEQDDSTWNTVTDKKKNRRKQPKVDAEEAPTTEVAGDKVENSKPNGINGTHGSNGINGGRAPKINAPVETAGDDADWSVA